MLGVALYSLSCAEKWALSSEREISAAVMADLQQQQDREFNEIMKDVAKQVTDCRAEKLVNINSYY